MLRNPPARNWAQAKQEIQAVQAGPSTLRFVTTILVYGGDQGRWVAIMLRPYTIKVGEVAHQLMQDLKVPAKLEPGVIGGRPAAMFTRNVPVRDQPGNRLSLVSALWERGALLN